MGKKASKSDSNAVESTAAAGAMPKKTAAARTKKHVKAQAVGVAAAVEGFVHSIVNAVEDRQDAVEAPAAKPVQSPAEVASPVISHEAISVLAYQLYLARHGQNGSPAEDWLRAEQTLRQRAATT